MPLASIPAYALYGEEDGPDRPAYAHIETIAARSSLHDWEIAPHRHHRSVQVLIVMTGEVEAALDSTRLRLAAPCHVTVPVGAVHGFRFAPASEGWVLTLDQAFAARARGPGDPLGRLLAGGGATTLPEPEARRIALLAAELLALAGVPHDAALFHAVAEALLRSLPREDADSAEDGGEDGRLARFRHLIETHLNGHRPVRFYAAALGMTERTLGRLCLRQLGCTPLEVIHRRVASEAQRLLRYTNATVAQVAEELGFADASYFSRFYLRTTGRRPSAERS
ncbi:helix-turn-helix domain-containing protein [Novosphingobium flavum]|uniref:Helix-turn-helix domain-containing protein n=1 Tax=Novosphingobium aerophilum TaxID=2839843 RepID=A0A7X1F674_9SPHN|nr:helix-turn-helix domain-containing protein [Novosphingobium aerophilum]MBC2651152.1 helix-turn-helix domain-containing protein [Novosphingobium aerophilum]MBC2660709.1 helix-turn-helix domain-containing protein [Novosphingobium aerophilum]